MPEQPPRRILEKSRTVRRKYQRSNKRFQFTASQIQRIEREEERERRAQQLREQEKRKIANKKKKAEKEAREREERRRLGLPGPDGRKITASQPLMLNFFGKKKEEETNVNDSTRQSTEDGVHVPQEDPNEDNTAQMEDHDTVTEFEDDWSDIGCILGDHHSQGSNHTSNRALPLSNNSKAATPGGVMITTCRKEASFLSSTTNDLCESFEDDTADLLNELDPSTILQALENTEHAVQCSQTHEGEPRSHYTPSPEHIAQYGQAQVFTGVKNSEVDDNNKENRHPEIFHDGCGAQQLPLSATPRYQFSRGRSSKFSGSQQALDDQLSHTSSEKASADAKSETYQCGSSNQPKDLPESVNELPFDFHVDTEDEFGDLELSTQELKDLDDMTVHNV